MSVGEKIWAYFLLDNQNRSYYLDNGVVKKSALPRPLSSTPDGWEDLEEEFGAADTYFGLTRSLSLDNKFVDDGAEILRQLYFKGRGFEEEVYLLIMRKNRDTGIFEEEYKAKVDMSTASNEIDGGVSVHTVEGGLVNDLNANEGATYEIPCDETNPDVIKIKFNGVNLSDKLNYETSELDLTAATQGVGIAYVIPITYINNEGDSVGLTPGSPNYDEFRVVNPGDYFNYVDNSQNYFITSKFQVNNARLQGEIKVRAVDDGRVFTLYLIDTATHNLDKLGEDLVPANTDKTFILNAQRNLIPNNKYFLILYDFGPQQHKIKFYQTDVSVSLSTRNPESTAYALRPLTLLQNLVSKISNGKYTADSSLFRTHNNIPTTCGDALRNIDRTAANAPIKNYLIKTTFKDFFQSYNAIYDIGIKIIDNVLYIERKADLYKDDAEIFDMGEVSDLKIDVASEYLGTSLKMGYPDQQYDQRAGKYEYNSLSEFKLPVTVSNKVLDWSSKYRGDSFGIEFIRTTLTQKDTTDSSGDNDVFLVNIEDQPQEDSTYLVRRKNYDSITGVQDNTVYNIEEMTPKRQLLAHGPYLRSLLYHLPTDKISLSTAPKNKELVTVSGGVATAEKTDVPVSQLGDPIFIPLWLNFTAPVPYTFAKTMSQIGTGHIAIRKNGRILYGLPIGSMKAKPATQEPQEWRLLMSPKTSLSTILSLSNTGLFLEDMNKSVFISDYNPVHFVLYNYQKHAKYHHKDLYEDWFENRMEQFVEQPFYHQKWEQHDSIVFQFITAGLGNLEIAVYNDEAIEVDRITMDIVSTPALPLPYILQQKVVDLGTYEGRYLFVLYNKETGVALAISEWQDIQEYHEGTMLYEYRHSYTKKNFIFGALTPSIRVESLFMPWRPDSDFVAYEDEPKNAELLNGVSFGKRTLLLGDASGLPDWLVLKLNDILLTSSLQIDGDYYTRTTDSKLEPTIRVGYPMDFYSVDVMPAKNKSGLSVRDDSTPNYVDSVVYTLDAAAFGQAPGVINVELQNE